jgi:glycerol-1-phosphate dehydrogenase [NAD(P)+]
MRKMDNEPLVFIEDIAIQRLIDYCQNHHLDDFALIADQNTYRVLGEEVHRCLKEEGWTVTLILLEGDPVLAGDVSVFQMLDELPSRPVVCLAVGSGTVTDVVRMTSHRTRNRFISVPTAPSVDGYSSTNAPLVARGFKRSVWAHPPEAIFAHLPTLQAAPQELIASGFGDMLGKFIAAADWNLGRLLWGEDYDPEIAEHTSKALQLCLAQADSLCARGAEGIRLLMEGLVESGLSMLRMGNSNPASGAEHHISHFLEMKSLIENGPHHLHGSSVALASIYVAEIYQKLRQVSREQVARQLLTVQKPDPDEEMRIIRATFGPLADQAIIEINEQLYMSDERFSQLKETILEHWEEILGFAESVPEPDQFVAWLKQSGGPTTPEEMHISPADMTLALRTAHYLRRRFTVTKLLHYMGMLEDFVPA